MHREATGSSPRNRRQSMNNGRENVCSLRWRCAGAAGVLGFGAGSAPARDYLALVRLGVYNTPGYADAVSVVGGGAYVGARGAGLQIIDTSDPGSPVRLGFYNTPGAASGVSVVGSVAYVADGSSGLQIIDISDPTAPALLGTFKTPGDANGVVAVGQ